MRITPDAAAKSREANHLDAETCAAIGNGRIDVMMFDQVKLAIAVLQAEGLHPNALHSAHILVQSIHDALDLLLKPERLIATLRA